MTQPLRLTGANVLGPSALENRPLRIEDGLLVEDGPGKEVDLNGFLIVPGIVDIHGDAFEKHLAPRRGAMKDLDQGLIATEAELAANGITTGVLAQFFSWEGGMRGAEFAERVFEALKTLRPRLDTTLMIQLRFETSMLDDYPAMLEMVDRFDIPYVVFNDHLPHDLLAKGKTPPGHVGKSLRIGRNPDKHLEYMHQLHGNRDAVPDALTALAGTLRDKGVMMGSHDERTAEERAWWRELGVYRAEFPETQDAAEAARSAGDHIILGAPNLVRGGSHKGNVSALELVALGLCDALASDYHYPSLRRAAFLLANGGLCDLAQAWGLISSGPARVLGLQDRGTLEPGKRADLVILDAKTHEICATMSGGQITYLRGPAGARFLNS